MRRHELDVFSLVAGILFLVVATAHVVDESFADLHLNGRWVAPVVLVVLGAAGLAGLVRGRGEERSDGSGGVAVDPRGEQTDRA